MAVVLTVVVVLLVVMNIAMAWMSLGMALGALVAGGTVTSVTLGVGPQLYRYRHFGTVYMLRLIPVGVIVGVTRIVTSRRRKLFAASGGVWWLLTAVVLCYLQTGRWGDATLFQPAEIDYVRAGSEAERAGLRRGDVLRAIDERPVRRWREAIVALKARTEPGTVAIDFTRGAQTMEALLRFERVDNRVLGEYSVFGLFPSNPSAIRNVVNESPAWRSGIRSGDSIRRIGQREIAHVMEAYDVLNASKEGVLDVDIERAGSRRTVRLERTRDAQMGSISGIDFLIVSRGGSVDLPLLERIASGPRLLFDKISLSAYAVAARRFKRDVSGWMPVFFWGTITDKFEGLAVFALFIAAVNLLMPFPPAAMAQVWWGHHGIWGPRVANVLGIVCIIALVLVPF